MDTTKLRAGALALMSIVVAVGLPVGLADRYPWVQERVPALTLGLLATLCLYVISHVNKAISELARTTEEKLNGIADSVASTRAGLEERLDRTHQAVSLTLLQDLEHHLAPELRHLFEPFIDSWVRRLNNAVTSRIVEIDPWESFAPFYIRTLKAFPQSQFLATSFPSREYFWKNQNVLDAVASFTAAGGSMRRIFFLDRPLEEESEEAHEVMLTQIQVGVAVAVIQLSELSARDQRLFVVAKDQNFAWEVFLAHQSRKIESTRVVADQTKATELRTLHEQLRAYSTYAELQEKDGRLVRVQKAPLVASRSTR
jgi:hypothetical protein